MSAMHMSDASGGGGDSSNPFYFNTSHWNALDGILEGVEQRVGLMVLTGPPGSGKTMLMRAISENLPESAAPLFLQYASLNFREFVNFLHGQLNVADEVPNAQNKAIALREFLYLQAKRGETGVVFIDEAHNLETDVFRMLPKLARFDVLETGERVGLQFVLIGNDDLTDFLQDDDLSEAREKIDQGFELRFFTRAELSEFLKKRLAPIARTTDEPITPDGVAAIGTYTGGSPRLVGMICSHAMLFAAENPGKSIDAKMVEEAADALMLKPLDDPFPHESDLDSAVTGPFSAADLDGSNKQSSSPEPKIDPEPETGAQGGGLFSKTDTIYASDEPSEHEELGAIAKLTGRAAEIDHSDRRLSSEERMLGEEDDAPQTMEMEAKQIAMDKDEMDLETIDFDEDEDDYDFDLGELDDGLIDDDFDDDDDDEDELSTKALAGSAAAAGGGLLSRFGIGKGSRASKTPKRIVGKARNRVRTPASTDGERAKRAKRVKTRVPGARERKLKLAGMGIGAAALIGGAVFLIKPLISGVSNIGSSVAGSFASETEQRRTAATPTFQAPEARTPQVRAPQLQATQLQAPRIQTPTGGSQALNTGGAAPAPQRNAEAQGQPAPSASAPAKPKREKAVVTTTERAGGWGAKVTVSPAAQKLAETSNNLIAAVGERSREASAAVLGGVESLLDTGGRNNGSSTLGQVFNAASDQIRGLRTRVNANGLTPEERAERIATLLSQAAELSGDNRIIQPAGESAYDAYREVLQLDPENGPATEAVKNIREVFSQKAEAARDAQDWTAANHFFETAIAISQLRSVPR